MPNLYPIINTPPTVVRFHVRANERDMHVGDVVYLHDNDTVTRRFNGTPPIGHVAAFTEVEDRPGVFFRMVDVIMRVPESTPFGMAYAMTTSGYVAYGSTDDAYTYMPREIRHLKPLEKKTAWARLLEDEEE